MAASLAVENFIYPFQNVKELVSKETPEVKRIRFGCKAKGSTIEFFRDSSDPIYRKVYKYLEEHPEDLANDNDEGEMRVVKSDYDYAFFMESASLEYKLERNCGIIQINGLLDNKGYGIAVKRDSPLLGILNQGLLQLQENGKLRELYDRWWKQKDGGGICTSRPTPTVVTSFRLSNVGGVFIVLLIGFVLSLLLAICELSLKKLEDTRDWVSCQQILKKVD